MAFLPRYDGMSDEDFQREHADIRPLRKHFYEKMGRKGFDDRAVGNALEELGATVARMEIALVDQPWLPGGHIGLADLIAVPLIDRLDDLKFAPMWEQNAPRVTEWFQRLRARPASAKAFYAKTRLSEFLPINPLRRPE